MHAAAGRSRAGIGLAIALFVSLTAVPAAAEMWCDLPFKDVAGSASAIALARYDADGAEDRLPVVELIRGELATEVVTVDPGALRGYRLRDGQLFVFALDPSGRPIRALGETGYCEPVSILPIHRGMVRARFRPDYDGRSRPLPLDELRAEMLGAMSTVVLPGTR